MKLNQPILVGLTFLVSVVMSSILLASWFNPQPQSLLNLYQSDLLLHVSEGQRLQEATGADTSISETLLGKSPVQDALKQYQTVHESAQQDYLQLEKKQKERQTQEKVNSPTSDKEKAALAAKGTLVDELELRLGLLYTRADKIQEARQSWQSIIDTPKSPTSIQNKAPTAKVLLGLWSETPQILPDAERLLQTQLKGWFRFVGLSKLYTLQQRNDTVIELGITEQQVANRAIENLLIVVALPVLGIFIGIVILLGWTIRSYLRRRKSLAQIQEGSGSELKNKLPPPDVTEFTSSVTWPLESAWQGMVLWFAASFFMGNVVLPVIIGLFKIQPRALESVRFQASLQVLSYMALMGIGYGVVQLTLSSFIPNVMRWLKVRWQVRGIVWGVGGYFAVLPIVSLVALLSQKILQNKGGGNPILEIILGSKDSLTIALLWFLVAVLAPIFEESLFRGFLLTSLAKHLNSWQAIAISGCIFALAHLNLADFLPLTVLGMMLGFVYWRSQNLLASMVLHSLWNSGSFIGLLILGSANSS
jgi:uncharacterized protein